MWPELIYGGILLGNYIYHRLQTPEKAPAEKWSFPVTSEGTIAPIVFGKTLVRSPVLAWYGRRKAHSNPGGLDGSTYWEGYQYIYSYEALYRLCVPFDGGVQHIHSIYTGDVKLPDGPTGVSPSLVSLSGLTGDGNFEYDTRPCAPGFVNRDTTQHPYSIGGAVEFYNGKDTQVLANNATGAPLTAVAQRMIARGIDGRLIPGYRGSLSIFLGLKAYVGSPTDFAWSIGPTAQPQQLSFEVSSYPAYPSKFDSTSSYFLTTQQINDDANPADVIAAILCDRYGKLALDPSVLDSRSFQLAAQTLWSEGNGFSRSFEQRQSAGEMLQEVLRQIDGGLYMEPTTTKWVLKLVRADYDPNSLQTISPSNCESINNFIISGVKNAPTKVRLKFTNRADGYRVGSGAAGTVVNSEERELIIDMPGVTTQGQADLIAARELAANSRPIRRCRAKVNRTFWNTRPLDVVNLNWPELNVANAVMRVASVSRGNASENCVYLDLIEDFFYVHRRIVYPGGTVGSFPGGGLLLG